MTVNPIDPHTIYESWLMTVNPIDPHTIYPRHTTVKRVEIELPHGKARAEVEYFGDPSEAAYWMRFGIEQATNQLIDQLNELRGSDER
ncbi:hypothetical protein SEA_CLARKSON_74 [Mycobacterium phage Clarkson]|nr:hypothetical protein SEA_PRINGAR_71 [Mycobacterium phage Pringar]QFP97625.1 hypothetical protein SEA_CORAZON_70 [Mycobacterium phage Corazon]URP22566.1 hypothetical protein SEA_HUPHLEPUFF_75 [Mycobacterium phage Huphlepuff]WAA20178.1 hypothetical protein SEA_CLARKSON_74 [Mycobacterium phage Clarkson]